MNLLTVEGLTKTFGEKKVFEDITFGIDAGDKIGVIGINGTGKSTLLKIIAGAETADSGNIVKMNGLRIGYLPQTPDYDPEDTVLGQVFNSNNPVIFYFYRDKFIPLIFYLKGFTLFWQPSMLIEQETVYRLKILIREFDSK